jgi:hypothetical protein
LGRSVLQVLLQAQRVLVLLSALLGLREILMAYKLVFLQGWELHRSG